MTHRYKSVEDHIDEFLTDHGETPYVELEAKVGKILSSDGVRFAENSREKESSVFNTRDNRGHFDSEIPQPLFRYLNESMNACFSKPELIRDELQPLKYKHLKEKNLFYDNGLRVTMNMDGSNSRAIRKGRASHLDIIDPSAKFDLRFSSKTEVPADVPSQYEICKFIRTKDRMTYEFNLWSFDLTRVETWDDVRDGVGRGSSKITYECELEIKHMEYVTRAISRRDYPWLLELAGNWLNSLLQFTSPVPNTSPRSLPIPCKLPKYPEQDNKKRQKTSVLDEKQD